ncbi:MAG: response regulator [Sulfurovum sp.]|nr:response regulator [Sulfurovum sp.]NNJ46014.1 response regulator [Sulfurovum sp.]
MVQNFKSKVMFSVLLSLIIGLLSFFLYRLTFIDSIGMGFMIMVFSLAFTLLNTNKTSSRIDIEDEKDSDVKYRLLEKKFKAISEKADMLEHEIKSTELFLASMSHEIRTPLNGIIGMTEVLDDTLLSKEQKEFVSMIRESSNNLRVIVNDVLDVSKLNAGKMELENIPFDLFTKIEASVGIFKPKIAEKEIGLKLFTDPMIPRQVIGDPTRLSQVIINLVSNALKFTDKGGKIDVLAEYIDQKKDEVTFKVSVSDSGIGLTKEQQEKIFEAYSQATASTARKSGGTGLGLTISSKIMNSMGTELEVESEEGEGATFFFVITMKVDTKASISVEKKENAVVEKKQNFDDINVLVAEDNPINQKLIKIVLENFGLKVTLASNGQEAYEARVNDRYDLIFMDIQMPVMSGVESTHSILEYEKENGVEHIPIIALTANALPGDKEKYMSEGMDDYATKPLDVKIIEKIIHQYCNITKD